MRDILRLSLPLTVWLVCFSGVYALHALVCSDRLATGGASVPDLGHSVLLFGWAVSIVVQVGLLVALSGSRFGGPKGFMRSITLALAAIGLMATLWTLGPVALIRPCG